MQTVRVVLSSVIIIVVTVHLARSLPAAVKQAKRPRKGPLAEPQRANAMIWWLSDAMVLLVIVCASALAVLTLV